MADLGNRANLNTAIDTLLDDAQPNESIQPSDHNTLLKNALDTVANGLPNTLRTNPETSGNDLEVTSGDKIKFKNSGFVGSLVSGTLTADKTYTLPDNTGTIALLSDIPSSNTIYTANDTIGAGRFATLTDTITFGVATNNSTTINAVGQLDVKAVWRANKGTLNLQDPSTGFVGVGLSSLTAGYYGGLFYRPSANYLTIGSNVDGIAIEPTANNQAYVFKTSQFLFSESGIIGNSSKLGSAILEVKGADTLSTSSALQIYDGDGTPSELLSVRNNGTFEVKNSLQTSLFLDGSNGRNSMGMGAVTRSASFFTIRNAVNRPSILRLEDSSGNAISQFGLAVTFNNSADGDERHLFQSQGGVTKFEQYHNGLNIMAFRNNDTSFLTTGFKIGGTTRDASSILELESINSGFLPPRMTTAQRDLISSPASGLIVYNTTANKINVYTGSAWETISSS